MFKLIVKISGLSKKKFSGSSQLWHSLEHYLEKERCRFEFIDDKSEVSIEVFDKNEALLLMEKTNIVEARLDSDDGTSKLLRFEKPSIKGRPKNTVFDKTIGKGMTLRQYEKHIKETSLTKTEIVKRGLFTKSKLETAIETGEVVAVRIGNQLHVTKVSLQTYLNQKRPK